MTNANECTCPSGDGSLRHPCQAHPAPVEQAGVAATLTFINGRPAMCGCQVEYSSGGGEYSDVIYVTLCAKHSGSAILDLVATNRIALTPEYEGQWHADLYLDREVPLAKAEGATPAEAVLALMSAERIDPEQESVEQAGGDERAAFRPAQVISYRPGVGEVTIYVAGRVPGYMNIGDTVYVSDRAPVEQPIAALAQSSTAPELERPEVDDFARVVVDEVKHAYHERKSISGASAAIMAQHARIVGALRAEIAEVQETLDCANQHRAEWQNLALKAEQERDAALAKLAELEAKLSDPTAVHQWQFSNAWFDGSEEVVLKAGKEGSPIRTLYAAPVAQAQPEETPGEILAAKLIETWVTKHGKPAPWSTAVEITAVATNMPNDERERLLALDDDVDAQAQHSVPEGWMLVECGIWTQEQVDEMQKTVARFRNSEFVDDRALAMAVADAGQCKAPEISLAELLAAEAQALRDERDSQQRVAIKAMEELAALHARVVVVPERDARRMDTEYPEGWNDCLDELARLNGKTVSEGLLRGMGAFAQEIISGALEGGKFDGADLQESAERHGLIAKQVMNEPCRGPEEYCACAWSTSFPTECYRITAELRALLNQDKENGNG
ncbi:hypothetical protein [Pseudomonas aeruginosa]|uniref:hypothetical protein n=1 Tax=Pseudomonas aeruginosa TaxID=287 RepID=UPI001F317AB2|nr:hypothetical protein [Pseudomonas aeruginosa]